MSMQDRFIAIFGSCQQRAIAGFRQTLQLWHTGSPFQQTCAARLPRFQRTAGPSGRTLACSLVQTLKLKLVRKETRTPPADRSDATAVFTVSAASSTACRRRNTLAATSRANGTSLSARPRAPRPSWHVQRLPRCVEAGRRAGPVRCVPSALQVGVQGVRAPWRWLCAVSWSRAQLQASHL